MTGIDFVGAYIDLRIKGGQHIVSYLGGIEQKIATIREDAAKIFAGSEAQKSLEDLRGKSLILEQMTKEIEFKPLVKSLRDNTKEFEKLEKKVKFLQDVLQRGRFAAMVDRIAAGVANVNDKLATLAARLGMVTASMSGLAMVSSPLAANTLTESISLLATTVGQVFVPVIITAAEWVQYAVDAWDRLNPMVKTAVAYTGLAVAGFSVLAVAGATVTMIFGKVVVAIGGVAVALKALTAVMMANPILAAIAGGAIAITGIMAAVRWLLGASSGAATPERRRLRLGQNGFQAQTFDPGNVKEQLQLQALNMSELQAEQQRRQLANDAMIRFRDVIVPAVTNIDKNTAQLPRVVRDAGNMGP